MSATRLATLGAILSLGLTAAAWAEEPARPAAEEALVLDGNLGIAPPEAPDAVVIAAEPDQARTGAIAPPPVEAKSTSISPFPRRRRPW